MLKDTIGSRIIDQIQRPAPQIIEEFKKYSAGNASDGMRGSGTMRHQIKPVYNCGGFVGPAVTLHLSVGDSLLVCRAIEVAQPSDVLVIDANGTCDNAVWGDIRSLACKVKGLAGVVIDGAVRDIEGIRETGFPVYARAVTCRSSSKNTHGEINVPISCGGISVSPGDIIIADESGVVAVPPAWSEQVLAVCRKKVEAEAAMRAQALAGQVIPEAFLKQMQQLGY